MNAVHLFGLSRSSDVSLVTSTGEDMTIRFDDSTTVDSRQLLGGLSTERWHHPDIVQDSLQRCRQVGSIIRRGENIPRGYSTEGVDDRVEMIGDRVISVKVVGVEMVLTKVIGVRIVLSEMIPFKITTPKIVTSKMILLKMVLIKVV